MACIAASMAARWLRVPRPVAAAGFTLVAACRQPGIDGGRRLTPPVPAIFAGAFPPHPPGPVRPDSAGSLAKQEHCGTLPRFRIDSSVSLNYAFLIIPVGIITDATVKTCAGVPSGGAAVPVGRRG